MGGGHCESVGSPCVRRGLTGHLPRAAFRGADVVRRVDEGRGREPASCALAGTRARARLQDDGRGARGKCFSAASILQVEKKRLPLDQMEDGSITLSVSMCVCV